MEKRFRMPFIASFFIVIFSVFLQFGLHLSWEGGYSGDTIPIIPGNTFSDLIISFLIPYIFMIIVLFFGPLFALNLVKIHKSINMNKYDYFIIPIEKKLSGKRILLRAIFPGLLAINIAIYVSLFGTLNPLFHLHGANFLNLPIVIEIIAIMIGIPVVCIIVPPLWMLESSGLMCSKKIESYNHRVTPDIESFGQYYIKMLRGYVGISTVVAHFLVLYEIFTTSSTFISIFIVIINPIITILIFMPISLFIEMRSHKTNARLDTYYKKLSIDITPRSIKIK